MGLVRLIDATLRDGGYCVDFQFTAGDTAMLVGMLDAANVGFIELGHGSGSFNHKAPPGVRSETRQAALDEEYFAAARRAATRAKLGIITGPFGMNDLGMLVQHRFDFVRLALMPATALERRHLESVERAKSLGLTVSINLMQTTAATPKRVAEIASEFAKAGADWFYVVDSSGGLLPGAVKDYVAHVRDATNLQIGFHAHHNSGMAIANCLTAIEAGVTMVDGTLQGLGRDVGNAPTEQLLLMLQRLGHELDIDVEQVCHAGDLVRGLLLDKGNDPTYYAAGVSEVHSTNVEAVVAFARSKGLGARSLIAAISRGPTKLIGTSMKEFPAEVIDPAMALASRGSEPQPRAEVVEVLGEEIARASGTELSVLADVVFARAAKWHKRGVLHLVPRAQFPFQHPLPWDFANVCGVTVGVERDDLAKLDFADRTPDVIVIDPVLRVEPLPAAKATYVDAFLPLLAESALTVGTLCAQSGSRVWFVCMSTATAKRVAGRAIDLGDAARVVAADATGDWLDQLGAGDSVILVDRDEPATLVAALSARKTRLLRPALATTIGAHIATLVDVRARLALQADGDLVDPVFVAAPGQVVVDDPLCPVSVVDGSGPEAISRAATARARSLMRGRGRL